MQENKARTHSIFEDPAIAESAKNDPFTQFISNNFKTLIFALVAVGLAMLAYNGFKTTAENKRAAATQALMQIQEGYDQLVTQQRQVDRLKSQEAGEADQAKKADALKALEMAQKGVNESRDRLNLMIDALSSPQPFDILAKMYKGLVAARLGDAETAHGVLTTLSWESVGAAGTAERMTAEIATLGISRALVDSPKYSGVAVEALSNLARKGEAAAVQAAIAVATGATTEDERTKARELLDDVAKRFPTQTKFLDSARERISM